MRIFILGLSLFALTSCYRMPGDEDYCLIPTTNNPTVTGAQPTNMMPSTKY